MLEQLAVMRKRAATGSAEKIADVCRIAGNVPATHSAASAQARPREPFLGLTGEAVVWPVVKVTMDAEGRCHVDLSMAYRAPSSSICLHSMELDLNYHKNKCTRRQVYQPSNWQTYLESINSVLKCEKQRQFAIYNNTPEVERPARLNKNGTPTAEDLESWLETPVVALLLVGLLRCDGRLSVNTRSTMTPCSNTQPRSG